jgi:dihydroorotate dehydrogenase
VKKPWLLLPPKLAHDLAPIGIQMLSAFQSDPTPVWRPLKWRGLEFKNPLGLAGGVDKDAGLIEEWWKLGAGFIEVGTVTPLAQAANAGKIIDRDVPSGALWNRMGFPGRGVKIARENLLDLPPQRKSPIFVNIGKNRDTPNERAAEDYATCMAEIGELADAFVINISSPNTTGLRDLFREENFAPFLEAIMQARGPQARGQNSKQVQPLLLKLSPDLQMSDLTSIVKTSARLGIDGFIATNTTLSRAPGSPFPAEGGVSGQPLAELSKYILRKVIDLLGSARDGKLLISAGGVMTPEDVLERLHLGADLVQVYTALVYEGPGFFRHVARQFKKPKV